MPPIRTGYFDGVGTAIDIGSTVSLDSVVDSTSKLLCRAGLTEQLQCLVFGDIIRSVYELKHGDFEQDERHIPTHIPRKLAGSFDKTQDGLDGPVRIVHIRKQHFDLTDIVVKRILAISSALYMI